ncbi:hypothetical protein JXA31_02950 [Candidatus Bathyarchaeota archaeon]|nr:hypothetical protein [Candidatus Bathyarchaeota archaeon]
MVRSLTKSQEQKAWLDCEQSFDDSSTTNVQSEWGKHGEHELVGQGKITNPDTCGKFGGFWGCPRTELHNKTTLDGKNHKGKVYVKKVFHSCDKPSCPICYKRGWAVREAGNIESRIKEAEKRFGKAEHIVVSVPKKDYGLSFEALQSKATKVMAARHILGGCKIFHAFRYHRANETYIGEPAGWFWSPHFHVIGFVDGGYSRCRHCKKSTLDCFSCDGYEGRTRRCYEKDGYIVKVLGSRKSIFGTAWYQLNHASVKRGVTRFHVARWFGTSSYRKMKIQKGDRIQRNMCPICGMDLVRLRYMGFDFDRIIGEFWIREFEDDAFDSAGNPLWVEADSGSYG